MGHVFDDLPGNALIVIGELVETGKVRDDLACPVVMRKDSHVPFFDGLSAVQAKTVKV